MQKSSLTIKDLTVIGAMVTILEVSKRVLDAIPNIELVSLLVIVFTLSLGVRKSLICVLIFAFIESMLFGVSTWTITYFYVWPILVLITYLFRRSSEKITFSIISAFFGLFFGMLCSLVTLFIGGLNMAISWWAAGIVYDIVHCCGNFIVCLLLFDPLLKTMRVIIQKFNL